MTKKVVSALVDFQGFGLVEIRDPDEDLKEFERQREEVFEAKLRNFLKEASSKKKSQPVSEACPASIVSVLLTKRRS